MKISYFIIYLLVFINNTFGCTIFAIKNKNGTIIGKNRDALYNSTQTFERMKPINQFTNWYNNNYNHNFEFYALVADNDVKMGINKNGLTAIEEDPLFPLNYKESRRFIQPIHGNAEGMILFGILQNFSSVDEIIPYLNIIFSTAAPNFYQIADRNKILNVEVAFAKNDLESVRNFTYQVINKNINLAHTNNYLSKEFQELNNIAEKNRLISSTYRLNTMYQLINNYENENEIINWFFDTKSNLQTNNSNYTCLNSSIFRSQIGIMKEVNPKTLKKNIYGSVSNMIVINNKNDTKIIIRILESIKTIKNNQIIYYKDLNTDLTTLFNGSRPRFIKKSFSRKLTKNNICG